MGNQRLSELVVEFVPLNRRRVGGDPPLSVLELDRWNELREFLAWELGYKPPVKGEIDRGLRVPTRLKVSYEADGSHNATLRNLSEGGLFVESDRPLAPGSSLGLSIDTGAGETPIVVQATVVWQRELTNLDGPAGFGVHFVELGPEENVSIGRLIDALLEGLADG